MYMRVKGELTKFEWDKWDLNKSYFKHEATPKETEEVFIDEWSYVVPDIKHSKTEKRFVIVGKTMEKRDLFIAFVERNKKIRVISARRMHKKEVLKYEEFKKDSKI